MKKNMNLLTIAATSLLLSGIAVPTVVNANSVGTPTDNTTGNIIGGIALTNNGEGNTSNMTVNEDDIIYTHYEGKERANVYKWGSWSYLNVAVTTGVVAGAVNTAMYQGVGKVVIIFGGIPGWAIGGLLETASWTKHGSKPGEAVAKLWDKNHNGWVGFYSRWGYDAAGRRVASQYMTK